MSGFDCRQAHAPQGGIDAKGRDHILALVSLLNASPVCYD
jgi:hypothetical protein